MYNEGIPLYEVCRQLVANASSLGALKYRILTFGPDEYEDLIKQRGEDGLKETHVFWYRYF